DRVGADRFVCGQAHHGTFADLTLERPPFLARQDADRLLLPRLVVAILATGALLVFYFIRVRVGIDPARYIDLARIGFLPVRSGLPVDRDHEGGAAQIADLLDRLACG